jgi:hypothetical protein
MPDQDTLPETVRRLVANRLESLEMVQVLLLLHADPDRVWTSADVEGATALDEVSASRQLILLRQGGLLTVEMASDATYRYGATGDLARAVDDLKQCYQARLVDLASLIASRPRQRLQLFADAFRLRKDD